MTECRPIRVGLTESTLGCSTSPRYCPVPEEGLVGDEDWNGNGNENHDIQFDENHGFPLGPQNAGYG
jgi:hypothetical protein